MERRLAAALLSTALVLSACQAASQAPARRDVSAGGSPRAPAPDIEPLSGPAEPAVTTSMTAGNFDGQGAGELVTVYDEGSDDWWISVTVHGGRRMQAPLTSYFEGCHLRFGGVDRPQVVGAADVRRDGLDQALVIITRGASTAFLALVGLDGGSIRTATVVDGANMCQRSFPTGGSVTHQDGFGCLTVGGVPGFEVWQWALDTPADSHADWYVSRYQWRGLDLHLFSVEHFGYPVTAQQLAGKAPMSSPPGLAAATTCDALASPVA